MCWALGHGQGHWLVREWINNSKGVKLRVSWVGCKWKGKGRWSEKEHLLGYTKHRLNVYSIIQGNLPRNSTDGNERYERTGGMEAQKYLRKNCCHRIECSTANFLATFMWRRFLNSAALATPTHRGSERVFNGTSTQVMPWMVNN